MNIPEPTDLGHEIVVALSKALEAHEQWSVARSRVNDDLARDGRYANPDRVRRATKHALALEAVYKERREAVASLVRPR